MECSALTKKPSVPSLSSAAWPIRVIVRMETTTYSESVSSTPSLGSSAPSGPMQKGTTYMVRPRIQPRYSSVMMPRISAGSIQLLVGPASSSRSEQMNVRDSTRATSDGSDSARKEFGFFFSSRRWKVPASTSCSDSRAASSSEPSAHTTRSGCVSSATSWTHASSPLCSVGAVSRPGMVAAVIEISCVCFSQPLKQRVAVVPLSEVNVGDIPAVKQEYVRSLTGTIQNGDSDGLSIQ